MYAIQLYIDSNVCTPFQIGFLVVLRISAIPYPQLELVTQTAEPILMNFDVEIKALKRA